MSDWRAIGDPDMLYRKLTCPIGGSETHWRLTCRIGDPSEASTPAESNRNFNTCTYVCLNVLIFIYFLLIYIHWNNILGHVEFSDQASRSPMGLRKVSDNNNILMNSYFRDVTIRLFAGHLFCCCARPPARDGGFVILQSYKTILNIIYL